METEATITGSRGFVATEIKATRREADMTATRQRNQQAIAQVGRTPIDLIYSLGV